MRILALAGGVAMPTPLENARKRLAELEREKADIEQFIKLYGRFSEGTEDAQSEPSETQPRETYPQEPEPMDNGDKLEHRRGATPSEIVLLMERVIREVGHPMTRGEIVAALDARDVLISAQDKPRYIGTIAWRHKGKFINVEGRGYWLRGEAFDVPGVPANTPYSDPPEEHSEELEDSELPLSGGGFRRRI
jgi:hypothetical protein